MNFYWIFLGLWLWSVDTTKIIMVGVQSDEGFKQLVIISGKWLAIKTSVPVSLMDSAT